jgi:two-component sensor histidine kinase
MKNLISIICWCIVLILPIATLSQYTQKGHEQKYILKLAQMGIRVDARFQSNTPQATRIMAAWDSLYDIGKKLQVNNTLPDTIWEQLILQEINKAILGKDFKNSTRLQFYLAHIYHAKKLFSKSIPIQLKLIDSSSHLTKIQLQKTYTQLEKAFVQTNEFASALAIRKKRLKNGLAASSYDLYQDFELHELALNEYLIYENPNREKIVDQYKYYRILGVLYFENGKIDSARKYFEIGLKLCAQNLKSENKKVPSKIHQINSANFKGLLGRCYMNQGAYNKAIELLKADINLSEDDANNRIFKMIHLANCYVQLKEGPNALIYINKLEAYLLKKEDKRMFIRFYDLKQNYFELKKEYDSAYYYAHQYIKLKDRHTSSISKNQAILLLSNIEADARKKDLLITKANLEIERVAKKAQNASLWASIFVAIAVSITLLLLFIYTIQKNKSRVTIEKKNEENELLLKELHHRVKNNLQVIYSLINLQKRRLKTPELDESLSMVQNRIKTMSLVHQNLHENDSLKDVNLAAYIKTISDYLKSLYLTDEKEITISLDIDHNIAFMMDKSITIGLLINEIMSNSLKYAFKGRTKGIITISIQIIQGGYQMKVSDNGNGFTNDESTSKSLGMYLIKNLVKQMQGKYEMESMDGTTYLIYFKA